MPMSRKNIYFYLSLAFAIWFLITSPLWTYAMNVVISFPFGIISFLLWKKSSSIPGEQRYRIIPKILIAGVAVSVLSLLGFLMTN
jgi:hypothetical protein